MPIYFITILQTISYKLTFYKFITDLTCLLILFHHSADDQSYMYLQIHLLVVLALLLSLSPSNSPFGRKIKEEKKSITIPKNEKCFQHKLEVISCYVQSVFFLEF